MIKKSGSKPVKKSTKKKTEDLLYIAGVIKEGDTMKYVAVQVRNALLLNPVEPIFEQYPGMECVVVGKDEETVRKNFEKLIS